MKDKCIIVDGPDCTGKTTICEKLSEIYNIPIYHLTYYNDYERHCNQFKTAYNMIDEWAYKDGPGFILDRYIMSETAYANVYRPNQPYIRNINEYYRVLSNQLRLSSLEVIFSLPYDKNKWFEAFKKAEQEREEMYTSEKISQVYDEYLKLWQMMRYNNNVWRYDMFENIEGQYKNKKIQL
jgi:thymidylate kinase